MLFKAILGQEHIKNHLTKSADNGRIPHAQLFVGPEGCGTLPMAIAYAQYVLCGNTNSENNTGNASCNIKFNAFSHPDLHFVFPVTSSEKSKSLNISSNYLTLWFELIKNQPYINLFDWYKHIGVDNKQGIIGVDEAQNIVKSLSLKAYEGGYKVMLIWMAEKMNSAAANKLLKLIEEPPQKTIFILIAEDDTQILNTILSRCQILHFPPLAERDITLHLIEHNGLNETDAAKIAHLSQGNFNKTLHLLNQDTNTNFEEWFVFWVRTAFAAKGNKTSIQQLLNWSETIAKTGRETQKQFLNYCLDFFRQALLLHYNARELVYLEPQTPGFLLEKFAPYIHGNNILAISNELQEALYHIERNGNAKIILTDLSIKLTRLIHIKA